MHATNNVDHWNGKFVYEIIIRMVKDFSQLNAYESGKRGFKIILIKSFEHFSTSIRHNHAQYLKQVLAK